MGFVQEVFQSKIFRYVYVFSMEKGPEVYELSEYQLSDHELACKKQMIYDAYQLPITHVRMENLK